MRLQPVPALRAVLPLLSGLAQSGLPLPRPGAVLSLAAALAPAAGRGERLWELRGPAGELLATLAAPEGVAPGEVLLLRLRALQPRMELELLERRAPQAPPGSADSGWAQLGQLRSGAALLRRQTLAAAVLPRLSLEGEALRLVTAWLLAAEQGLPPSGPQGQPLWLWHWPRGLPGLESPHDAEPDTPAGDDEGAAEPPAPRASLVLLLRWRGRPVLLHLQRGRGDGLHLVLVVEDEETQRALRAEQPRWLAALARGGHRLLSLAWRQRPLPVPHEPGRMPAGAPRPLLDAAALLLRALEDGLG